jgi:hypothetical protein
MRIRQAVPPPKEESLVALRFNMPLLRSSRRFWNLEAIEISLLRELQTRLELRIRHSEFQNLVGVDSSADRCRPRKRGRSIRT